MLIDASRESLTYRCDTCQRDVTVKPRKSLLESALHTCRSCNARKQAKLGGAATAEAYRKNPDIARENGRRLNRWSTENGACRLGGLKAAELGVPSKAGKIGGKRTAESGKLREAGKLAHTESAEARRFQTRKERGLLFVSKPELEFLARLRETFAAVEHHVTVGRYSIDFHVIEPNVHVQFDGEYWHGLTAAPEMLTGTPAEKYRRDRECDEYCRQSGVRLVRVTDREFRELSWDVIVTRISNASMGPSRERGLDL